MKGQEEVSDEVTVVERQFLVARHRRQKYRCRCNGAVVTAPGPRKLIPGGRYSPAFAVEVAAGKYLDHLPLERQSRMMQREGLEVGSQTLWDQLDALASHLEPTYRELGRRVLEAPLVHADETHWRLMAKSERKKYWAWCVTSADTVFYRIFDNRAQGSARQLLSGYRGIVLADGYGAYEALARAGPGFTLAHCWAHVRRKFVEIESHYPRQAGEILDLIGKLYAVEREMPAARRGAVRDGRSTGVARAGARGALSRADRTIRLGLNRSGVSAQRSGPGDAVHDGALARSDPLPGGSPHSARQQSGRAGPARLGGGPQEPLWLAVSPRLRSGSPVVQFDRDGQALRRRAEKLPAARHLGSPRAAGHGDSPEASFRLIFGRLAPGFWPGTSLRLHQLPGLPQGGVRRGLTFRPLGRPGRRRRYGHAWNGVRGGTAGEVE